MHCPAAVMKFSNNLQQTRQEKDSGESNTHKQSDSLRVMQHLSSTEEIHYFWLLKPQPLTRSGLKFYKVFSVLIHLVFFGST